MKQKLFYVFIAIWFFGTSYTIAHMHSLHMASFDSKTNFKIEKIDKAFGMVHILTEKCGCSEIIANYLVERKAHPEVSESVMFLGPSEIYEDKLKKVGFNILNSKELDGYIEGVPLLLIHDKNGNIKYSGGYAKSMVTPITPIQDLNLLKQVKENINPSEYLVQGCAVAKSIKKELDPLGLKYNL